MEIYHRFSPEWQDNSFNNQHMEEEFHIGSIIRKVSDQKKIGPTELGKKIDISPSARFRTLGLGKQEDTSLLHNEIKHLNEENELLKKMVRILEEQKRSE